MAEVDHEAKRLRETLSAMNKRQESLGEAKQLMSDAMVEVKRIANHAEDAYLSHTRNRSSVEVEGRFYFEEFPDTNALDRIKKEFWYKSRIISRNHVTCRQTRCGDGWHVKVKAKYDLEA